MTTTAMTTTTTSTISCPPWCTAHPDGPAWDEFGMLICTATVGYADRDYADPGDPVSVVLERGAGVDADGVHVDPVRIIVGQNYEFDQDGARALMRLLGSALSEANSTEDDAFLTAHEAAERLGVDTATLDHWRITGDGPMPFKLGRRFVYRRSEIDAWKGAEHGK